MDGSVTEYVLKRDRLIALSALAVLTLLAWSYIMWLAQQPMPAMTSDMTTTASSQSRSLTDFALVAAMWAAMMIGMMTPSVAPTVLLHAALGRKAAEQRSPLAATAWFAGGYLLSWVVFSICAAALQLLLVQALVLTPQMKLASQVASGVVLMVAGLYQWLPLKNHCLSQCRDPLSFIQRHGGFRQTGIGTLKLGARHGLYCIGCCWALMALLFVGGVMNILWIAGLSILVLAEKVLPAASVITRLAGAVLVLNGLLLLVRPFL